MPALKRTTTSARSEPIDDLALALVAPLGADYDDVCHLVIPAQAGTQLRLPKMVP